MIPSCLLESPVTSWNPEGWTLKRSSGANEAKMKLPRLRYAREVILLAVSHIKTATNWSSSFRIWDRPKYPVRYTRHSGSLCMYV